MANEQESAELRVLLGSDTDQQGYNIGGFLVDTSTWKKIPLAGFPNSVTPRFVNNQLVAFYQLAVVFTLIMAFMHVPKSFQP